LDIDREKPGGNRLKKAALTLAVVGFVSLIAGTAMASASRLTTVVTIHSYGTIAYSDEELKAEEDNSLGALMIGDAYLRSQVRDSFQLLY
jgi:hypothetical protein